MDRLEGHWSKRTILEPDTGKVYNKYFYKRKPAYRVVVDTPQAKVLAGYVLVEKDLRSAIGWLSSIKEILINDKNFTDPEGHIKATYDREKFNLVKGLFVAALTFYGKCFSQCEGRKVKLEKSNLNKKFHEEHDNAMSFRHNFAAHSGAKKLEFSTVVVVLDKKKKELPFLTRELAQPDTFCSDDLDELNSLFNHAKEFADKKIGVLSEKVYQDDVVSKGNEYWYKKVT